MGSGGDDDGMGIGFLETPGGEGNELKAAVVREGSRRG